MVSAMDSQLNKPVQRNVATALPTPEARTNVTTRRASNGPRHNRAAPKKTPKINPGKR
jgi:hypothetical protein